METTITDPYQPCPCNSGKKFKFCCREKGKLFDKMTPRELIKQAADYPIYECLVNEGWQGKGLATLLVVRQLPNLKYIFGTYLVDIFCLGLKNTFCNANAAYSMVQHIIQKAQSVGEPLIEIDYESVRSIVFGSIEYAKDFGFDPNPDWKDSQHILEPQRPFENRFEFGSNGEPVYIQGPDDDPMEIMTKLNQALNKNRKKGIFRKLFGRKSQASEDEWKTPKFVAAIPFPADKKELEPQPLPTNNEEWFEEITLAFRDAAKTKPFGKFVGRKITPRDYFQMAPLVCLKFRGIDASKKVF